MWYHAAMKWRAAVVFAWLACGPAGVVRGGDGAVRALHADGQECWAVGDAGLILHSADQGRSWKRIPSFQRADFRFITRHKRRTYFYGGRSLVGHPESVGEGVILCAEPGQTRLRKLSAPAVGWLYGGAIAGGGGIAFGQASPACPSGIWKTLTGGRLWKPLLATSTGPLVGGAFHTPYYGYVVGLSYRILSIRNFAEPRVHPPAQAAEWTLRDAAFCTDQDCWAVGDTGTILTTDLAGRPWRQLRVDLPAMARRLADFETVAAAGPKNVWIAGGLIGVALHTTNGGTTWRRVPMPDAVHDLAALADEKTILAAGNAGRIWRSEDAGATWRLTRGPQRTDVLFLLGATDRSLYPAIVTHALAGLNVAVVYASHAGAGGLQPRGHALRAAAVDAGAGGVTVLSDFPSAVLTHQGRQLTEDGVLAHWTRALDGTPAAPVMVQQLAAAIRLYRPTALIVASPTAGSDGARAENHLVARLARQAADAAAKPDTHKELAQAGLKPWTTQRIFTGVDENDATALPWRPAAPPRRRDGILLIDSAQFPAGRGTTLEQLALRAGWHLPWSGLTDRPPRQTIFRHDGPARLRLATIGLARGRLDFDPASAAQRDLATAASIRFAAATQHVDNVMPKLLAAAKRATDSPPTAAFIADRMLLVWTRLLERGRLFSAQQVRRQFLDIGSDHPMYARMRIIGLAETFSSEWQAQFARQTPVRPRKSAETQLALRHLAAMPAWRTTLAGQMLYSKALIAAGRQPAGLQTLKILAQNATDADWRQAATLEAQALAPPMPAFRVRCLAAKYVPAKGKFDGLLDDPFWQQLDSHPLHLSSGQMPAASHLGTIQALRSRASYMVFGIALPAATGRRWQVDLAIDADRDAWTQLVLRWDTHDNASAVLLTRLSPPVHLDKGTFTLRSHETPTQHSYEVGLALGHLARPAGQAALWRFQIRAVARDPGGKITTLYFHPQKDPRLLPHRYGLLQVPPARPE